MKKKKKQVRTKYLMFNHFKRGRTEYLLDRDKDLERLLFFSLDRDLYLRLSLERDLSGKQKLNSKTRIPRPFSTNITTDVHTWSDCG